MAKKYNPFRPKGIVTPGMFSGRLEEIESIEHSFVQTKHENPQHFIVEGERGIGKSSLMFWAELYARGQVKFDNEQFNFLVVSAELNEHMAFRDIVHVIADKLKRELEKIDPVVTAGKTILNFVKRFEAFGVKYKDAVGQEKEFSLIDDLAELCESALEREFLLDGVMIFLDEADKPAAEAHLGALCKALTERLTKLRCDRVGIGLAGLPELMDKLVASHPSSVRVFETFTLQPLSVDEREYVIRAGLGEANKKNSEATNISDEALGAICTLSEGYPHFLQQFAYSAFDQDVDGLIDINDVLSSAYKENGALHQLGRKYFENILFVDIRSENYRKVLMAMSEYMDGWVERKVIRDKAGVSETILNNALNALKARKIIIHNERGSGEYRLPTKSFAVWLKAFGSINRKAGSLQEASWAGFVASDAPGESNT